MTKSAGVAITACMRNEGLMLLEWIAYHRVIGFDPLVICTNACTDGSDTLLDLLASHGSVVHLPHSPGTDDTPQDSGMRRAMVYLHSTSAEWTAHIDADEFINIGLGNGHVSDLMAKAGEGDVIALPWWAFGDSGHARFPGEILAQFTRAEPWPEPDRTKFKSIFRFRKFAHANDHMPRDPNVSDPQVRSARGDALLAEGFTGPKRAKYRPFDRSIRPRAACVHHYAVPSRDVFLMKNDRGDGQGKSSDKYHLGSRWHQIANRNDAENTRILRHLPATRAEMTRLRTLPGVAAAERACLDWHQSRTTKILTADQIKLWSKSTYSEPPA